MQRRAARGDHHRRAGARDRHRVARRRGRGHVPRHGRHRCARCGVAPGAAGGAWRSTSRARTRSTSSSAATPTSSSTAPSRRRSSTTRARRSISPHLLCAAHEGALSRGDAEFLGPRWEAGAEQLVTRGRAAQVAGDGVRHAPATCRAGRRTLPGVAESRCARRSPTGFAIVDVSSGELLGDHRGRARATRPSTRARSTCTSGAPTRCVGLDLSGRRALVAPFSGDWYTQPKRDTETDDRAPAGPPRELGVQLSFGEVSVTEHGARLPAQARGRPPPDRGPRAGPARDGVRHPGAVVRAARRRADRAGRPEGLLGTLHATEHAQIAVLPLIAMCDRWDIGGLSTNIHPQTGCPTIFIYDGHPGGIGIARHALRALRGSRRRRPQADRRLPLRAGCPSCVQSPKCGNLNEPLSRPAR